MNWNWTRPMGNNDKWLETCGFSVDSYIRSRPWHVRRDAWISFVHSMQPSRPILVIYFRLICSFASFLPMTTWYHSLMHTFLLSLAVLCFSSSLLVSELSIAVRKSSYFALFSLFWFAIIKSTVHVCHLIAAARWERITTNQHSFIIMWRWLRSINTLCVWWNGDSIVQTKVNQ